MEDRMKLFVLLALTFGLSAQATVTVTVTPKDATPEEQAEAQRIADMRPAQEKLFVQTLLSSPGQQIDCASAHESYGSLVSEAIGTRSIVEWLKGMTPSQILEKRLAKANDTLGAALGTILVDIITLGLAANQTSFSLPAGNYIVVAYFKHGTMEIADLTCMVKTESK
jgi:hypothetical protein